MIHIIGRLSRAFQTTAGGSRTCWSGGLGLPTWPFQEGYLQFSSLSQAAHAASTVVPGPAWSQ